MNKIRTINNLGIILFLVVAGLLWLFFAWLIKPNSNKNAIGEAQKDFSSIEQALAKYYTTNGTLPEDKQTSNNNRTNVPDITGLSESDRIPDTNEDGLYYNYRPSLPTNTPTSYGAVTSASLCKYDLWLSRAGSFGDTQQLYSVRKSYCPGDSY